MSEIGSVCSTCLKSNISKLTSVTDLDFDGISYLDKLRACVSADLDVDESNVPQMCEFCTFNLNLSYKFRETVLESLQMLKDSEVLLEELEGSNIEENTVVPLEDNNPLVKDEDCSSDNALNFQEIIEQMKQEAIERKEELSCSQCSLVFKKEHRLQQHIEKVHNKSNVTCVHCGNIFKTTFHLKEHLTTHTGEKDFSCSLCDKAFPRHSSLNRHMKTHYAPPGQKTKKTPFLCTICGKNFPFSNGAARHMRIHLGVKQYECQICHRKFNQTTHLQVHMRTHSGEKPYICENCGECFTLRVGLRKHLKTRHKIDVKEEMSDKRETI